ncbi:hypothetical protein EMIT053CA3_130114 [Pseudomonas donghuensis]
MFHAVFATSLFVQNLVLYQGSPKSINRECLKKCPSHLTKIIGTPPLRSRSSDPQLFLWPELAHAAFVLKSKSNTAL